MTEAVIEPNPNIQCIKRPSGQIVEEGGERGWLVILESTLETPKGRRKWTHGCGAQVLAGYRVHTVWYDRILGGTAGGGETVSSTIPYCPDCEQEPSGTGGPVVEVALGVYR